MNMNTKKRKVVGRDISDDMIAKAINSGSSENVIEKSPVHKNKTIVWEPLTLPSKDLLSKVRKMRYNKRSFKDLNESAVSDILPSIRKSKCNSVAVKAVYINGFYYILGGTRRAFAVSLVEDAELKLYVCNTLDEEEIAYFCDVLDKYRTPSVLDEAYAMEEFIKDYESEHGKKPSIDLLKKAFDYGKTSIHNLKNYAKLPKEIIGLFPSLHYIPPAFLQKLIKHDDDDYLATLAEGFDKIDSYQYLFSDDDDNDEINIEEALKAESAKLQEKILKQIKADKDALEGVKQKSYEGFFKDIIDSNETENKKGIKLKTTKNGIAININENQIDDETLQAFLTLLKD